MEWIWIRIPIHSDPLAMTLMAVEDGCIFVISEVKTL